MSGGGGGSGCYLRRNLGNGIFPSSERYEERARERKNGIFATLGYAAELKYVAERYVRQL
jgi:hypothetical protein